MKTTTITALTLIAATLLSPMTIVDAIACGNSARFDKPHLEHIKAMPDTVHAEAHLNAHLWSSAINEAQDAYPELKKLGVSYQKTKDLELKRAAQILAVSTIRLNVALANKKNANKQDLALIKKQRVSWSIKTITHLHNQNTDDPKLSAFYAEALAQSDKTKPKALAILSGLHQSDLVPDAYGYALLAKLHTQDKAASQEAHKRCMMISSENQALCDLTLTPAAAQPKAAIPRNIKNAPRSRSLDKDTKSVFD